VCRSVVVPSVVFPSWVHMHVTVQVSKSQIIRHTRARGKNSSEWVISLLHKFYLHNTQQTQETNIHTLSGIRTRNPSNQTTPYTLLHSLPNTFITLVCKLYKYLGPEIICTLKQIKPNDTCGIKKCYQSGTQSRYASAFNISCTFRPSWLSYYHLTV
jgi:hypothetical protein